MTSSIIKHMLAWPVALLLGACAPAVQPADAPITAQEAASCPPNTQPVRGLAVQSVIDGDYGSALTYGLLHDLPDAGYRVWKSSDYPDAWQTNLVITGQIDRLTSPNDQAALPYVVGHAELRVIDRASGNTVYTFGSASDLTGTPHPSLRDYVAGVQQALLGRFCQVR